jgi:hypothetical protein
MILAKLNKKFNKKQGWTFHGHEFLGGKMVKKSLKGCTCH